MKFTAVCANGAVVELVGESARLVTAAGGVERVARHAGLDERTVRAWVDGTAPEHVLRWLRADVELREVEGSARRKVDCGDRIAADRLASEHGHRDIFDMLSAVEHERSTALMQMHAASARAALRQIAQRLGCGEAGAVTALAARLGRPEPAGRRPLSESDALHQMGSVSILLGIDADDPELVAAVGALVQPSAP